MTTLNIEDIELNMKHVIEAKIAFERFNTYCFFTYDKIPMKHLFLAHIPNIIVKITDFGLEISKT